MVRAEGRRSGVEGLSQSLRADRQIEGSETLLDVQKKA